MFGPSGCGVFKMKGKKMFNMPNLLNSRYRGKFEENYGYRSFWPKGRRLCLQIVQVEYDDDGRRKDLIKLIVQKDGIRRGALENARMEPWDRQN